MKTDLLKIPLYGLWSDKTSLYVAVKLVNSTVLQYRIHYTQALYNFLLVANTDVVEVLQEPTKTN